MYRLITIVCTALLCFLRVESEVTVLRQVQTIYDTSPKLRIRGTGFGANAEDISLDLGLLGQPLIGDKDYVVSLDPDGDGLILVLQSGRRWVDLSQRVPPGALVLSSVKFKSVPNKNQLDEPVIVTLVLATPSVVANDLLVYMTASNEVRINGTGLVGAKKCDLYFNPPIFKEITYVDVTHYPIPSGNNQITLRLRLGYTWREAPGPLVVIGIDTGAGPVKLNGDVGIQVGTVLADVDYLAVTVDTTASYRLIYHDEEVVTITGQGFNVIGNVLRFANGLLGNNVNYTTISTTETTIKLRLMFGSKWRRNLQDLPGALTLIAVNTGSGFIAVGPPNSGKGCDVATVFERPVVYSGTTLLFRSQSHSFYIQGTGFPSAASGYTPELRFSPPLIQGVNYTLRVADRTQMELTLINTMAWRTEAGPLYVTDINTRGDGAGWVTLPGAGVHVAEVIDDLAAPNVSYAVQVIPTGGRVYQSALRQRIVLTCRNLQWGTRFVFDPSLVQDIHFTVTVVSASVAWLNLNEGKIWRYSPGNLVLTSVVTPDGTVVPQGGPAGVRVAYVLADPVVVPGTELYHTSQSKVLVIHGFGFTNIPDTTLALQPTPREAYKLLGVLSDAIRVQLKPDYTWLPHIQVGPGGRVAIQLHSIDTGAGEVVFPEPVILGYIIPDVPGATCIDSCEFAFDGVCDERAGFFRDDDFHNSGDDDGQDYSVAPCVAGTDCTDCGGVDVPKIPDECSNDCVYAHDKVCDDPRGFGYCALGTDCDDCGPVSAGNQTARSIIRDTSATQRVYNDQTVIFLAATVLHPTGSAFRWSNKMRGDGVDYDLDLVDHATLALRRTQDYQWERNFYQLPTVLYLEAVNDGMGSEKFRTLPGRGVGVATVFPRPNILPSASKLFRTQSNELHLQGVGFPLPDSGFKVELMFHPELKLSRDYTVRVVSHTDLFVVLSPGASWSAQPGALMVTAVNTAGGEQNWMWFAGEGVSVAEVHWDPDDGNWSRQMLTWGAVVLVVLLCGFCYRRSVSSSSGAVATQPPPLEVRYQKVAASERDLELTARKSSTGGIMSLVPASEVIVCADVEEAGVGEDPVGADSASAPIREAVYSDHGHAGTGAHVSSHIDSAA